MQTTLNLYSLSFTDKKTYYTALLFIIGNIALPQLCHLISLGGPTWLPIYFFTLIGAYKYGWRVGIITALVSPLINSMLFGMPSAHALAPIVVKSTILAICAGYVASKYNKASLLTLTATILAYQIIGTLGEWAIKGDLLSACQDFRIGIPGMLLQIVGGWLIINHIIRK
ncbi:MAG: ECF transporter S component [Muribaculaceae bacterium]|nr:ECF transporter S component [Muribaculaceae bacterium]